MTRFIERSSPLDMGRDVMDYVGDGYLGELTFSRRLRHVSFLCTMKRRYSATNSQGSMRWVVVGLAGERELGASGGVSWIENGLKR